MHHLDKSVHNTTEVQTPMLGNPTDSGDGSSVELFSGGPIYDSTISPTSKSGKYNQGSLSKLPRLEPDVGSSKTTSQESSLKDASSNSSVAPRVIDFDLNLPPLDGGNDLRHGGDDPNHQTVVGPHLPELIPQTLAQRILNIERDRWIQTLLTRGIYDRASIHSVWVLFPEPVSIKLSRHGVMRQFIYLTPFYPKVMSSLMALYMELDADIHAVNSLSLKRIFLPVGWADDCIQGKFSTLQSSWGSFFSRSYLDYRLPAYEMVVAPVCYCNKWFCFAYHIPTKTVHLFHLMFPTYIEHPDLASRSGHAYKLLQGLSISFGGCYDRIIMLLCDWNYVLTSWNGPLALEVLCCYVCSILRRCAYWHRHV
ncbi:hypothetical protein BDA96_01G266900 [Sorghum bicolor]|uniref:Uncharacterized protein n=2 Tax=Sorghum bicolor TaxID=4558 RepID=A0A921S2Z1_SORBI|nr:hypothetical protein BDA96_01G266900 [Sorghum bicolor]OQU91809.1 hypothetical protein SORBI_3001G252050 [Sorghum bicolor]